MIKLTHLQKINFVLKANFAYTNILHNISFIVKQFLAIAFLGKYLPAIFAKKSLLLPIFYPLVCPQLFRYSVAF